jgi:hypothetical protein
LGIELTDDEPEIEDYHVWPEHEHAVMTFLRCQTQWRTGSGGGVMGLDYRVILDVMALYDVPNRAETLEDIQVMEYRAAELINEKTRQEAERK